MRIKSNSKPSDVYEVAQRDGVMLGKFSQLGQDLNCTSAPINSIRSN